MSNVTPFLKEQYQKWKDRIKRIRYYRQNKNTSLFGQSVNLLFAELLLFATGYLWFVQRTRIPMLSLFLSLTINALLTIAFVLRRRKSFQKEKAEARHKAARKFLAGHMKQLDRSEFKWHIMRLLLKLEGIGNIKSWADYLETTLHGKRTAVGYYNANFGEEIPPQPLAAFLNQAKAEGFAEAIFVASGAYSEPCRAMAEKRSTTRVHLLDLDDLLEIMEKSGMFPDEKVIDALIDEEINSRKRKFLIFRNEILTPKRIRTYLGYSLFFLLSGLFQALFVYYTVASVAFLLLALVSWLRGRKTCAEPTDNQKFIDALTTKGN
jgi:membrane protein implicated in regulation of membrane protease activity